VKNICRLWITAVLAQGILTANDPGAPVPVDAIVVVEDSASMSLADPRGELAAALRSFPRGLPSDSRLGMVLFAGRAQLVQGLTVVGSPGFESSQSDATNGIRNRAHLSDLASGVERAVYELRERGRPNVYKVIFLITDGRLAVPRGMSNERRLRWLRELLTSEAKKEAVHIYPVVLGPTTDVELAQTLALSTDGIYFRADHGGDVLPALLAMIRHFPRRPAVPSTETPTRDTAQPNTNRMQFWNVLLALSLVLALGLTGLIVKRLIHFSEYQRGVAQPTVPVASSDSAGEPLTLDSGDGLSSDIAALLKGLESLQQRAANLRNSMRKQLIDSHSTSEDVEKRYLGIAHGCINMIDHFDILGRREDLSPETVRLFDQATRRLNRVLESVDIEEIPIETGSRFDGNTQEQISKLESIEPYGIVTKIERRGFNIRSKRGIQVLRPAGVQVTCRPTILSTREPI
jgi:molecular chaperone GrpE (heat shock protein)